MKTFVSHVYALFLCFVVSFQEQAWSQEVLHPSCLSRLSQDVKVDYLSYYTSLDPLYYMGGIVALSAALSYSHIDKDVRDWWQQDVHSPFSKKLAKSGFGKIREEGVFLIPLYIVAYCTAESWLPAPYADKVSTWGAHTFRSLLLGAPQQIFLTHLMGGKRPTESTTSHWHPFKRGYERGVSGHAFYGALPFLNAAQVTDHPVGRIGWYVLSTLPAWARIDQDKHYLSQVLAGWSLAFLMTEHVNHQVLSQKTQVGIFPIQGGAAIQFQRSF